MKLWIYTFFPPHLPYYLNLIIPSIHSIKRKYYYNANCKKYCFSESNSEKELILKLREGGGGEDLPEKDWIFFFKILAPSFLLFIYYHLKNI